MCYKKEENVLIAASSHSLTQAEINYSQGDKELFAAVWGILHFSWYLLGHCFILVTDNKACSELLDKKYNTKRETPKRLESWRSKIHGFYYTIELVRSKDNIADFMSRCHNKKQYDTAEMQTIYMVMLSKQIF